MGVSVNVGVGVSVGVCEGVTVAVKVGVEVGVSVGVCVAVAEAVGVSVGMMVLFSRRGTWMNCPASICSFTRQFAAMSSATVEPEADANKNNVSPG